MKIRSVLKWLVAFVFIVVTVAGGTVWWFWTRSDQMLFEQIIAILEEKAPDWDVRLGNARFDWQNQSRVYLSNLSLTPPGETEPLLFIPASVVYLDGDLLRENTQILIRKLVIQDCRIHAVRFPDGSWNLDALRTLKHDSDEISFPEIHLNEASAQLELQHPGSIPPAFVSVGRANLRLIPGGKRFYEVQGGADIDRVGTLSLSGEVDLDHFRWSLKGQIQHLPFGKELLEFAAEVEPAIRAKLVRVERRLQKMCADADSSDDLSFESALEEPARDHVPVESLVLSSAEENAGLRSDAITPASIDRTATSEIPDFGLTGETQLDFRIGQTSREAELDYAVLAKFSKGQLENPLIPFPLRQLAATIYFNPHQFQIRELSAVNGETKVQLAANVAIHGLTTPGTFVVNIQRLPISAQLKHLVNEHLKKIYETINPTGMLSLRGTFHYDGLGHWRQEDSIYEFSEGSILYEKFQYPIHDVTGTIVPHPQEDGHLLFEHHFRGKAGQREVTFSGWNRETELGHQAMFHVDCSQVPVDERLIEACDPKVQKTLRSLNLHGKSDVRVSFYRTPEREKGLDYTIDLDVSQASTEYERFPYAVQNLSGQISFRSVDDVWMIRNVRGMHGDGLVTGSGTLNRQNHPERLELSLQIADAAIDHQLEHAIRKVVPRVWDELSPGGFVTAKVKLVWIPDWDYLDVDLPSITVRDGSLLLKSFRYPLDHVSAQLSYDDNRVEIQSFEAWHDETKITGTGEYHLETDELWRLTFDKLEVWDLLPDRQFRSALPDAMAAGIDTLSPDGSVTIKARTFELRGSQNNPRIPVTAAWDFDGYVAGMNLIAGLELSNVHGTFTSSGIWDGRWVKARGVVDLDSAFGLDQQLTKVRGPFQINQEDGKQVLIVGSEELLRGAPRASADSKSLTASVIGGTLSLNARAVLGDQKRDVYGHLHGDPTNYEAIVDLNGGRLEEYVRQNFAGGGRLQGVVNGLVTLEGTGDDPANLTGRGSVTIAPAALYELPVILQIFQGLNIAAPPDKAAFDEAYLNFEIRNKQFEFSEINLLGNSLSLRGHGTVRFDQKVNLEFFSIVPKAQPVIPIIKELYQSASYGAVKVDVKGSVSQPQTKVQSNFDLTPAVRTFLSTFQPFRPLLEGMPSPQTQNPGSNSSSQIPFLPRR